MENNQNAPVEEKNTAAVVALVLGIVSLVFDFIFPWIGLIAGVVGIVFAVKGRKIQAKKGMATGGLVCSIIGVCLGGIFAICAICVCTTAGAVDAGISSIINSSY